eukprot:gene13819-biopygen17049
MAAASLGRRGAARCCAAQRGAAVRRRRRVAALCCGAVLPCAGVRWATINCPAQTAGGLHRAKQITIPPTGSESGRCLFQDTLWRYTTVSSFLRRGGGGVVREMGCRRRERRGRGGGTIPPPLSRVAEVKSRPGE